MGLPMAVNLRAKIQSTDTLTVFDVNGKACEELVQECGPQQKVTIARDVRQVAEESVRSFFHSSPSSTLHSDELLSKLFYL